MYYYCKYFIVSSRNIQNHFLRKQETIRRITLFIGPFFTSLKYAYIYLIHFQWQLSVNFFIKLSPVVTKEIFSIQRNYSLAAYRARKSTQLVIISLTGTFKGSKSRHESSKHACSSSDWVRCLGLVLHQQSLKDPQPLRSESSVW